MMAPPTIIDYIVVHELCHFRHLDHTEAFWNEVDKVIPSTLSARNGCAKTALRWTSESSGVANKYKGCGGWEFSGAVLLRPTDSKRGGLSSPAFPGFHLFSLACLVFALAFFAVLGTRCLADRA
jgi:hypothetical protein